MPFEWCSLVPLVMGLFGFAYITFEATVIACWLGFFTLSGFLNNVFAHLFVFKTYYHYWKAVTLDPGSVPQTYQPPPKLSNVESILEPDSDDEMKEKERFCMKCNAYKAPRSYHCTDCRKCVLKMDHHCPWVNNCVGFNNHKHFVLFLFFMIVGATHFCVLFAWRIVAVIVESQHKKPSEMAVNAAEIVFVALQVLIILPTELGVCFLFGYQVQLIMGNTTSVESYDRELAEKRAKRKGKKYRFPYDRGTMENVKEVLGWPPTVWLRSTEPVGDGLSFPTNKSTEDVV